MNDPAAGCVGLYVPLGSMMVSMEPVAKTHLSLEWLAAMGTTLEQCATTIDRAVMSGAEVRPPETD